MRPVKYIYFCIAFLVTCLIIFKSFDYIFHPDLENGFLAGKKDVFNSWYKYFLYFHIFFAPLTIISGILQFSLNRKNIFHRISGYVYITSVVFASIGGFAMSFRSIGGYPSGISFGIMATLWIYFTLMAFISIRNKNFERHKIFMTRSFILANSAILLRIFLFISNYYFHFDPVTAYIFIAWLSWVPWLLFYEIRIRIKKPIIS